jgi:hypothetical protein
VCGTTNDDNAVSCWNCDTVLSKNKSFGESFRDVLFGPTIKPAPIRVMPGYARKPKKVTKKKAPAKKSKTTKKKIVHTKKTKKVKKK